MGKVVFEGRQVSLNLSSATIGKKQFYLDICESNLKWVRFVLILYTLSAQLLPSAFLGDIHRYDPSHLRYIPRCSKGNMTWGGGINNARPISCLIAANPCHKKRFLRTQVLSVRKARFFSPPQKSSLLARFGPDCHIKFLSSSHGSPSSPSQWLEKVTPGEREPTPNLILLRHKESVEKRGGTYFGSPLKRGGGDPPPQVFFWWLLHM